MIKIYQADKTEKKLIEKIVKVTMAQIETETDDVDVEITIVDEETIKELNSESRNINDVTDVLSFQAIEDIAIPVIPEEYPSDINGEDGSVIIGEIFICRERAKQQGEEFGHGYERELAYLTCHGLLHLVGYDHIEKDDEKEMTETAEEIMVKAGFGVNDEKTTENDIKDFRSGFVAIVGRPNAGKSTLINTIVGEKVAIVSWKPQTTRNKILGIYNEKGYQIIFIDTPGIHKPRNSLGNYMMKSVEIALEGIDCIVYLIDCEKGYDESDKINIVSYLNANKKVIIAVNKVDHVEKEKVFLILTELNKLQKLTAVVPISALRKRNIEPLKDEIKKLLTDTVKYYDDEHYTDKNMRFMTAEIIREKALRLLDKEVPYGIGVDVREYAIGGDGETINISADIICEKAAHKPIILGKGGSMIRKIGTYSRQDLEAMTGTKVFINLYVRVKDDWRESEQVMKLLGYDQKNVD